MTLELELLDLLASRAINQPPRQFEALLSAASGVEDESDELLPETGRIFDFVLPNAVGTAVQSSELLASGPIVLLAFRGFWSALDVERLVLLDMLASVVDREGGTCLGLSPVVPVGCLIGARKAQISLEMLSDVGAIVSRRLTTGHVARPHALWALRRLGVDIPRTYGLQRPRFGLPCLAVIGRDSRILFQKTFGPSGPVDRSAFARAFETMARA